EAGERRAEARPREDRRDDVERREEDELVPRSEGDAREDLQRLDPEHRERHARDRADVAHDPAPRPEPLIDRVLLGPAHLPLEAMHDRPDTAAREALPRCPDPLGRLVVHPAPATTASSSASASPATTTTAASEEREHRVDR